VLPVARFRLKRVQSRSPYVGWMKWHHFSGLIFGIVTLTWGYSGLLSLSPFDWFRPVAGGRGQAREARQKPASPPAITLEQLRTTHGGFANVFPPKALRMTHVDRESYWVAERAPSVTDADQWRSPSLLPRAYRPRLARAYVSVAQPERGTLDRTSVGGHAVRRRDAVTCGDAGGRASGCACPYGRRVPLAFVPEAQVTPFALL
jgi:hypothetical protein